MSLLEIPWEDVLCRKIFPYLTIEEVYRLKCVSKQLNELATLFVTHHCKRFDFSNVGRKRTFGSAVFHSLTSNKHNIARLNMTNCYHWLEDQHLLRVLELNVDMTHLRLPECQRLHDATFMCVGNFLNRLQLLDVSFCRELSNDALVAIGGNLRTLQSLDVSGCWLVNDSAIKAVALNNRKLTVLRARLCYSLTDACIEVLARSCTGLQVLDIQGCWRVRDTSIIAIRKYCKTLREIFVKDCTGVSEISLARLRPAGVAVDVECPAYNRGASMALVKLPMLQI